MSDAHSYASILKQSEGLYKEKGSKFLGFAIPVTSIAEAKRELERLRELHPKAVHVCFAWRLGISNYEDRYSDDGEPNNSAGKPIFGQIVAAEITNVLIAVVRYYGGTKLGVGGLVSAYKTAAKSAIANGEIVKKVETVDAHVIFNPSNTGSLMSILNLYDAKTLEHGFEGQQHLIKFRIPKSLASELMDIFERNNNFELKILE